MFSCVQWGNSPASSNKHCGWSQEAVRQPQHVYTLTCDSSLNKKREGKCKLGSLWEQKYLRSTRTVLTNVVNQPLKWLCAVWEIRPWQNMVVIIKWWHGWCVPDLLSCGVVHTTKFFVMIKKLAVMYEYEGVCLTCPKREEMGTETELIIKENVFCVKL